MLFSFEKNNDLCFESYKIPEALLSYALPFSQCVYRQSSLGEILTQWILGSDYSFWVHYFFVRRQLTIVADAHENIISLVLLRKGRIAGELKGFGKVTLKEGECRLYYVPADSHNVLLMPDFYSLIEIDFHSSHFIPIAGVYPEFEPMLSHAINDIKDTGHHGMSKITREANAIIDQILQAKMNVAERSLFVAARIRDLLRWYVSDQAKQRDMAMGDELKKKRIAERLLDYIDEHLDEDLSVKSLARMSAVSTSLLQDIFRMNGGKPVHVAVNEKRMERAAFLLLSTDEPVGEIVSKVTPISFASFCTSFKKHFGKTPREYRKTSGENQNK